MVAVGLRAAGDLEGAVVVEVVAVGVAAAAAGGLVNVTLAVVAPFVDRRRAAEGRGRQCGDDDRRCVVVPTPPSLSVAVSVTV